MYNFKVLRIKKSDLKKDPDQILAKVGAIDLDLKRAYPSHVHMSYQDYTELTRNLRRKVRKLLGRYATKQSVNQAVSLELLQFGPSTVLGEAVRPGYVLVDTEGLQENIDRDRKAIEAEAAAALDLSERRERMNQPGVLGAVRGFFEKNFGDPRNLSGR